MASHTKTHTVNRRLAVRLGSGGLAAVLVTLIQHPVLAAAAWTLEVNKAIVRRVFTVPVDAGDVAVIHELYAPDVLERAAWEQHLPGPAGRPSTLVAFRASHRDLSVTVDALIAEGDQVAAVATWCGPHPPAGTHVVGRTLHVFRIVGGQIVEEWSAGGDWLAPAVGDAPSPANPLVVTSQDR